MDPTWKEAFFFVFSHSKHSRKEVSTVQCDGGGLQMPLKHRLRTSQVRSAPLTRAMTDRREHVDDTVGIDVLLLSVLVSARQATLKLFWRVH